MRHRAQLPTGFADNMVDGSSEGSIGSLNRNESLGKQIQEGRARIRHVVNEGGGGISGASQAAQGCDIGINRIGKGFHESSHPALRRSLNFRLGARPLAFIWCRFNQSKSISGPQWRQVLAKRHLFGVNQAWLCCVLSSHDNPLRCYWDHRRTAKKLDTKKKPLPKRQGLY